MSSIALTTSAAPVVVLGFVNDSPSLGRSATRSAGCAIDRAGRNTPLSARAQILGRDETRVPPAPRLCGPSRSVATPSACHAFADDRVCVPVAYDGSARRNGLRGIEKALTSDVRKEVTFPWWLRSPESHFQRIFL